MRRINELHLEHSFAGSRMLRELLLREGFEVGRRHVGTLMRRMGIEALYRKPNTGKKHQAHPVFPYLLRATVVERANQAWALLDITYIPMARRWVYLVAVLDRASRRVLAHLVSITMEAQFCVEPFNEAVLRYGPPEIVNTDQGSQLSGEDFVEAVKACGARQSMDGKGCWRDKVFVERLWRSVKYEDVYLRAYDSVSAARHGEQMVRYYGRYSNAARGKRRKQGVLDDKTPEISGQEQDTGYRKKCRANWARLIQKIYEIDRLTRPKCKGKMRILAFIEEEVMIRKILEQLGLWDAPKRQQKQGRGRR